MATKYNGLFPYSGNFKMQYAQPLDNRIVCENTKDLLAKNTFGDINKFAYDGMIVAVPNDGIYYLKDSKTLINLVNNPNYIDPTNVTNDELEKAGWQRITNYTSDYLYGTGITTNASAVQFTGDYYGTAKNTNGALGWYVWRHNFLDDNGNEISYDSDITITNVKLKYAPNQVKISNNISIKLSDWFVFSKAFNNRSIVTYANATTQDNRRIYNVTYFQLSPYLNVTNVNTQYQFTYSGNSFKIEQIGNYKYLATSLDDPSITFNCIAQVKDITQLTSSNAYFAVIIPNTDTTDGSYKVNFSLLISDDHFGDGLYNIYSNNNKSLLDADFIPTLNWNAQPTVANINKCKLYVSNKQATIDDFVANNLPIENSGNLFTNLDSYTGVLSDLDLSYTQNSHFTSSLKYISHEYTEIEPNKNYNILILSYSNPGFGDTSNTNIYNLFTQDYGDEEGHIRSWDTSLRFTQNPELGCTQIFNFTYAEGFGTVAAGGAAHAEGKGCRTYEDFSHVEGSNNTNIGYAGHVEGWSNTNYGYGAHVEGQNNYCKGNFGHVEGQHNIVNAPVAHAEGYRTIASSQYQHVGGKWNVEDTENKYAFIIGNGTTNEKRSNAFTVSWDGIVNTNMLSSHEIESQFGNFVNNNSIVNYRTNISPGTIYLGETGDGMELKSNGNIRTMSDPVIPVIINGNLQVTSNLIRFESDVSGINNPIHININENATDQPSIIQAKGWFIQGWALLDSTNRQYKLWLGKDQKAYSDITNGQPTSWAKPNLGTLATNDVLTIYNNRHWLNKLIVEAVNSDGTIQVKDISTAYTGSTALPPNGDTNLLNFRYGVFVSGKYNNNNISLDTSKVNIGEAELTFNSLSFGNGNTVTGLNSVSFGRGNTVLGQHSISVGVGNKSLSFSSVAFGDRNRTGGEDSFAAGIQNGVDGFYSAAFGQGNGVYGEASFAAGMGNQTGSNYQTVIGKYNKSDWSNKYAFIIGNGTADAASSRSNALTVDWNGNIVTPGNISSNQIQTTDFKLTDGNFVMTASGGSTENDYIKCTVHSLTSKTIEFNASYNYIITNPDGGKCYIDGHTKNIRYENSDEHDFTFSIIDYTIEFNTINKSFIVEMILNDI